MKTSAQFWAKSRVDNNVIKDFPNKKLNNLNEMSKSICDQLDAYTDFFYK